MTAAMNRAGHIRRTTRDPGATAWVMRAIAGVIGG
jgi:hypothetical protein